VVPIDKKDGLRETNRPMERLVNRGIAGVWAFLAVAGLTAGALCVPGQGRADDTPTTETHTYTLTPGPIPLYFVVDLSVPGREVAFSKEPDFGNHVVFRGALRIGPENTDFIGVALDRTDATLYLDLNRNLDLTDDPQGIHQQTGPSSYLSFPEITLDLLNETPPRSYKIDISSYASGQAMAAIRSGWTGDIEVGGSRIHFSLADNLDGTIGPGDQFTLGGGTAGSSLSPPRRLFLDGKNYAVTYEFTFEEETSKVRVAFREVDQPVRTLPFEGDSVSRLIFQGTQSTVFIDNPTTTVTLPLDTYYFQQCALAQGNLAFWGDRREPLIISDTEPAALRFGGPLQPSVDVRRLGTLLEMNYTLLGQGGETYSAQASPSSGPPTFKILQGDKEIASGSFEYG
jgi:hypothetical protein